MFDHPLALELAYIAVEESIRLGASYADARYEARHTEEVVTHNGVLSRATNSIERGLGVRVLVRGSWGYVGISEPTRHDVAVAARRAVEIARAAAILQDQPVELARSAPQRALYRTKIRRDPLAVPLEDKLGLLLSVDEALRGVDGVTVSDAGVRAERVRKVLVSSDGCEVDQELVSTGVGYRAGAVHDGEVQFRSFPGGRNGLVLGQGWELVTGLPLLETAPEVAEEAVELSRADVCPEGAVTAVLTAPQLAHHTLRTTAGLFELDRIMSAAISGSDHGPLSLEGLGSFMFGSELVNLHANASEAGAAGTFGFDDEGVEAQRIDLVDEGRFVGVLSNRESAAQVGLERSMGCARATDWSKPPTVWAPSLSVSPGEAGTLEGLLADTKQGVLLDGPGAFTVDASGRTYTASSEVAWAIEGGKRGKMLKNPVYQGATVDFWRGCDALCGDDDWGMYGAYAEPRGRARGALPVGVGSPSGRFRGLSVGSHALRPAPVSEGVAIPRPDSTGEPTPAHTTKARKTKRKTKSKRVRKKDTK